MIVQLGIRGSTDSINHILIKIDNLTLMTCNNLFLSGEESRIKTGKNIIELLDALWLEHEISVRERVAKEIERELNIEEGTLIKYNNR
tara:strand:- start:1937 stop:2200 length:264 start_codon:yes stop_codon:yes gene_type:complete